MLSVKIFFSLFAAVITWKKLCKSLRKEKKIDGQHMLILVTEMVTFEGKTFSGEARFDGIEKNQWLPILFKIAPTLFLLSL